MDGSQLKAHRERLGLSQAGLAEQLGVSGNTVARWERDEMAIPPYLELALKSLTRAPSKNKFADYLRNCITEQRLTFADVAKRSRRGGKEISVGYLNELVAGRREPLKMSLQNLVSLAAGLGKQPAELLYAALEISGRPRQDQRFSGLLSQYHLLSPKGKTELDVMLRLLESLIAERIQDEQAR